MFLPDLQDVAVGDMRPPAKDHDKPGFPGQGAIIFSVPIAVDLNPDFEAVTVIGEPSCPHVVDAQPTLNSEGARPWADACKNAIANEATRKRPSMK